MQDLVQSSLSTANFQPARSAGVPSAPVPMLSIVYHPDSARIGDFSLLPQLASGQSVQLARQTLQFESPDGLRQLPLGDVYVSRKPMSFMRNGDCYQVEAVAGGSSVDLDGTSINGATLSVPCEALEAGLLLVLAERVVLLWHLARPPEAAPDPDPTGLLGNCAAIAEVRHAIFQVAPLSNDVLILGESGTGKELVASALHAQSGRREKAYISVNMSAIPGSLASSELFGSVRGAYTGAQRDQPGYFLRADGGTLFLDEIGDAPREVQATLLRALEAREIQPVGGEPIKLDVRIVSATDADLDAGVTDESFKTALRHRLSRFEIRLPSLRQRRSDIAVLARDFLELEFTGQGEPGRLLRDADDPQLVYHWAQLFLRLSRYNWPGNVRELRNVITQIVINSLDQGEVILPSHVDELLVASQQVVSSKPEAQPRTLSESADLEVSVDAVRDVLKMSRWEVAPTARALGVSRQRVYRVIEQEEDLRTAADLRVEEVQASFRACDGNLDTMCDELQVSRSGLQRRLRDVF